MERGPAQEESHSNSNCSGKGDGKRERAEIRLISKQFSMFVISRENTQRRGLSELLRSSLFYLLSIRMTRVCPEIPRPNSHPRRLTPCRSLLFRNLTPIKTYRTQISVIGPTKKRNEDTSNACVISMFFTCERNVNKSFLNFLYPFSKQANWTRGGAA